MQKQKNLGYIYAILAFMFWGGISPIYFKEVSSVYPFEVLIYRIVFSFVILLPLIFYRRELNTFFAVIKDFKKLLYLFISTFFISLNWLLFIWAITNDKILEASLGYYINPLVNIFLGFLFLNERLSKNQYLALFVALLAVLYQFLTLGYVPVVSLMLAFSFGIYGLIRKKVDLGSIVGLFVEILLILPFALVYLIYIYFHGGIAFVQNSDFYISFMLALGGFITVVPLLLFNTAARSMKLSTLGFFQYLGPTLAFLVAVFIYNEHFNSSKLVTFCLIWLALVIFSWDSIKKIKS